MLRPQPPQEFDLKRMVSMAKGPAPKKVNENFVPLVAEAKPSETIQKKMNESETPRERMLRLATKGFKTKDATATLPTTKVMHENVTIRIVERQEERSKNALRHMMEQVENLSEPISNGEQEDLEEGATWDGIKDGVKDVYNKTIKPAVKGAVIGAAIAGAAHQATPEPVRKELGKQTTELARQIHSPDLDNTNK